MMKRYLLILFCIWNLSLQGQVKESYLRIYHPDRRKPSHSFCIFYDKNENIIKAIQKDYYKGHYITWINEYSYDALGQKKSLIITEKKKGSRDRKYDYTFIYSNEGYEQLGPEGKRVYYLDKKKTIKEESFSKDGVLKSQFNFEYDSIGRALKSEYNYLGDDKQNSLQTYSYNDKTMQRTDHYEEKYNDSLRTVMDCLTDLSTTYKPIRIQHLTFDNIEIFKYDKFDNEIETRRFNSKNEVIEESKTKYKYWK